MPWAKEKGFSPLRLGSLQPQTRLILTVSLSPHHTDRAGPTHLHHCTWDRKLFTNGLVQWFPISLGLQPFNTVSRVVVTTNHTIIFAATS